jgi:hypothetical protein
MRKSIIYLIVGVVLLSSCANSIVTVSDKSKPYYVYVDKKFKGMSTSKVGFQRSGFPQKKLIEIKDARGKVIAHEKISRDFNAFKFLAGWFYLYPLWFFMWEYDNKIEIYIDKQQTNTNNQSPWDSDSIKVNKSPWD